MPSSPSPQPILCGTDFFDPARHAADAAAALAVKLGAPLHLIHATVLPASPQNQVNLDAEVSRLRQSRGSGSLHLVATILEGNAGEVLVQSAQEHQAQLMVVSSLGRRAPARWLLGSVAERTALASPIPTLVVRSAEPFMEWARGERPLRVFVGADFTASSDAALRWVAEFRKHGPCEVIVACSDHALDESIRLGVPSSGGTIANPPAVQQILERDLREKISRILGPEEVELVVQGGLGPIGLQLIQLAMEARADVIVTGTHQRRGLSRLGAFSVSRALLHHSPMSVVCVPAHGTRITEPQVHECRRVLVAVDPGEPHGAAAAFGYGTCHPGGIVHLLHVLTPSKAGPGNRAQAEALLRALIPDGTQARGITTEIEVVEHSDPPRAIGEAARRCHADVVCVGTHTRPGPGFKLLGSVALAVLQQSEIPVLIVRPPAD
jgi:nucleotide-binding universal stress UspA family protein